MCNCTKLYCKFVNTSHMGSWTKNPCKRVFTNYFIS